MADQDSKASAKNATSHKRECHKCKFNGKGDPICLDCPGPADRSYKGVRYVFLDDIPDPEGMLDQRIDRAPDSMRGRMTPEEDRYREPRASRDIPHVSMLPEEVEEAMIPILAGFFAQDIRRAVVVQSFWRGEGEKPGAKEIGISPAEYRERLAAFGAECPEVMKVCQRVRAEHMKDGEVVPRHSRRKGGGTLWESKTQALSWIHY